MKKKSKEEQDEYQRINFPDDEQSATSEIYREAAALRSKRIRATPEDRAAEYSMPQILTHHRHAGHHQLETI